MPSDLKGGDNSTKPTRDRRRGRRRRRSHRDEEEVRVKGEGEAEVETRCSEQKAVRGSRMESRIRKI